MSALDRLKEAATRVKPKYAVPVESDDLRELIASAESTGPFEHIVDGKQCGPLVTHEWATSNHRASPGQLVCCACGDGVDVTPAKYQHALDLDRHCDALEAMNTANNMLRAELAGAQSQAAAACRERDDGLRVVRELRQKLAVAGVEGSPPPGAEETTIGALLKRARMAETALAARDAEVPGLSTTPGYTMDDVAKIEAARGRPYTKLRETVRGFDEALVREDVLRKAIFGLMGSPGYIELSVIDRDRARAALSFAATGNETKGVES